MTAPLCQEGGEDCEAASCPDPRFPKLDEGDCVLCAACFEAALEEMHADVERWRDAS
jgi:polyferredoxin